MAPPTSIDAYLRTLQPDRRDALQALRRTIHELMPGAEECIKYSMPAFRVDGKVVAGFLATAKGCSYYPFSGATLDALVGELAGYSRTKSALHFDPGKGLPRALVEQLLRTRLAEASPPKPAKRRARASATSAARQPAPSSRRETPPTGRVTRRRRKAK
ncbi:hypothetical protein DFJ74DRAFT_706884 [Hyaloraphidium curvatum]|nr:hypothetical protein DFJ74DRAFT_706884 [Hyaloraphidium curvatum]